MKHAELQKQLYTYINYDPQDCPAARTGCRLALHGVTQLRGLVRAKVCRDARLEFRLYETLVQQELRIFSLLYSATRRFGP